MEQEFYWPVFLEHIGSASVIPFLSSITLEAMKIFGGYELLQPVLFAIAGVVVGCALNWLVGRILAVARLKFAFLQHGDLLAAETFMQRYGFMLAAFYWAPLGALLPLICGFFRCNLFKVLIAVALGAVYNLSKFL